MSMYLVCRSIYMCVCMFTCVNAYVPMVSQRSKVDAGIFFLIL